MSDLPEQRFENHKFFPTMFVVQLFGCLLALVLTAAGFFFLMTDAGPGVPILAVATIVHVLVSVTLFIKLRTSALMLQDRIVRLEMQVRLARVLPEDLQRRADALSLAQLIGLRFASDGELAELTRKVLDEGIESGTAVKRLVQDWRPDHMRV